MTKAEYYSYWAGRLTTRIVMKVKKFNQSAKLRKELKSPNFLVE